MELFHAVLYWLISMEIEAKFIVNFSLQKDDSWF